MATDDPAGGSQLNNTAFYCAATTDHEARLVSELEVVFTGSGIVSVLAATRTIAPKLLPAALRVALAEASSTSAAATNMPPVSKQLSACPGAGLGEDAVAADVQCQGVSSDICFCIDGAVRCALARQASEGPALTAAGLVQRGDLQDAAQPFPWCQGGDDVHTWALLQVRGQLSLCNQYSSMPILQAACRAGQLVKHMQQLRMSSIGI